MATMLTTPDLEVHDPRLTDEANAALTQEVAAVLELDRRYGGPAEDEPWHHTRGKPRTHHQLTTAAFSARILIVPVAVLTVVVALVPTMGSSQLMALIPFTAVLIAVGIVIALILSMTRELEHVSPETAALLESQGILDPDRLFGDLLDERRHAH